MQYSLTQWLLFFFLYCFLGWIWGNYCSVGHLAGTEQHSNDFYCRNDGFNRFGIWYGCSYAEAVSCQILGL